MRVCVCMRACVRVSFSIGNVLKYQGKLNEALAMYQQSLAIKFKVFGPEHPNVAIAHNNIGNVYQQREKYMEALQSYNESLTIMIKSTALITFLWQTPRTSKLALFNRFLAQFS